MRLFAVLCLGALLIASAAAASSTNSPATTGTLGRPASASTNSSSAAAAAAAQAALQAKAQAIVQMIRDANELYDTGDIDSALVKINDAIQADPRSVAAYLVRGGIYAKKQMYPQAQNDFETASLLAPTSVIVQFNLAEIKFIQKQYQLARPEFVEIVASNKDSEISDLANYKVFLCDLFSGQTKLASKELDLFNAVGANPSYYYGNAAWDLFHHQTEKARGWIVSAANIYEPHKNSLYMKSLTDLGYLPLPPPPDN
jgi:tetratricopeptide (TPR) repeat protein